MAHPQFDPKAMVDFDSLWPRGLFPDVRIDVCEKQFPGIEIHDCVSLERNVYDLAMSQSPSSLLFVTPVEIIRVILGYLPVKDLLRCKMASKLLNEIITESSSLQFAIELAKYRMRRPLGSTSEMPYATHLYQPRTLFNHARLDARGSELNTVGGNQNITINYYYSFDPVQITRAHQRLPGNFVHEQPPSPQIQLTAQQALADPTPLANDPVQDSEKARETYRSDGFWCFKMLIAFFSCGAISPSSRQAGEGGALNGPEHSIPLSDMVNPGSRHGSSSTTPTTPSHHWPQQPGGMRIPEPIRFSSSEVHRRDSGLTSPSNPSPWTPESHITEGLASLERAHTLQFQTPMHGQSTVGSWGPATRTPVHNPEHSPASPSTTSPWILESNVTGSGARRRQTSATVTDLV
ncbi:hypothetical protein K435DRAFT_868072 [Dendrothele bispora CBS 962.96]|uniref:F-box domain-containing protein n=1 Tax=Dendrothele bispora (strain CBS 962.96) TaxID=1314807 RepID=A0A4S8LCN1_DENBC|nr:hypothetical protein K435DRAFT_868072 [Dendrothele bispora CBS 962.96]